MSTPLLQQFPSLSGYPTSFLKDLLSSPQLVEAYLFTLPQIQELAAEVERLSKENEDLASESGLIQDIVELTFRG
jgi:ESCRT-I complex subunit VPS37